MRNFLNKLFGNKIVDIEFIPTDSVNDFQKSDNNKSKNLELKFINSSYHITNEWIELFAHFILLDDPIKMPSKSWYKDLEKLISQIGVDDFINIGTKWIEDCLEESKNYYQAYYSKYGILSSSTSIESNLKNNTYKTPDWVEKVYGKNYEQNFFIKNSEANINSFQFYFFYTLGGRILRGFIHSSIINHDKRLLSLVDLVAKASPNTSHDCIHIYSNIPKEIGIPKLGILKLKVKNKNILLRIDKAITEIGRKVGMTKSEIEETQISDFQINSGGQFLFILDGLNCIYETRNLKESFFLYINKNGKEQKTVPVEIKNKFEIELKEFKKTANSIKQNLISNRSRIEEFYLLNRKIKYEDFISNYINNNLVKILSKDLIWNFQNQEKNINLLYNDNNFIDSKGEINKISLTDTEVSLWHPIGFSLDYILEWRNLIIKNKIFQPFKQAFREIYILTDAEISTESYSNRYASHILKKDHVAALSKIRGWSPSGIINDGKISYKIPGTDLKAEYWVSDVYLGEHSKIYGSAHISTDQVRFYKKKDQILLSEVPAMIFSEVMRDIDLFVGVTSIGNDPDWHDRGIDNVRNYWSSYSNADLTESSKMRVEILQNIIPKMNIAKNCAFDGKYLKVKGKIRNYKIHLGSGNILMEPNDAYLCIVPDRSVSDLKKVFIPFEGDNLLSIIISKAILLVDDDLIKDTSIVSQINLK